jgi:hypothetical protein
MEPSIAPISKSVERVEAASAIEAGDGKIR